MIQLKGAELVDVLSRSVRKKMVCERLVNASMVVRVVVGLLEAKRAEEERECINKPVLITDSQLHI